jgi:uncharacterized OB-fold protein
MGNKENVGMSNREPIPIGEGLFTLPSSSSERPYLIGSKCRSCGETFFPGRLCCRRCSSEDMEAIPLSRIGKLHSFTLVRVKPPHFIGEVPYLVGTVELPEGERVKTLLTGCRQDDLKIGMEMELVIESVGKLKAPIGNMDAGTEVLGWKFRPLRRGE